MGLSNVQDLMLGLVMDIIFGMVIISHAIWWGQTALKRSYIICKAQAVLDDTCFDLQGNMLHLNEFREICKELATKAGIPVNKLTISSVITYLRKNDLLDYKAVRVLPVPISGLEGERNKSKFIQKFLVPFTGRLPWALDLLPRVQVCLFEARALSFQNYTVVWPQHFANPFV